MTRRKPYELNQAKGTSIWRSLEDKHADPSELQKRAAEEQPGGFISGLVDQSSLTRRSFVKGSSIAALAGGVQGCIRRPENEILPYSKAPEDLIPGVPSHFATVTARGRDALGLLVTCHDGRPTKVEGNEQHPRSLGATDVRGQQYVWDLYDPDRSKSPAQRKGNALVDATNEQLDDFLSSLIKRHEADQGNGLGILTPLIPSETFRQVREKVRERFPKVRFFTYSPVNDDNVIAGTRIAFGNPFTLQYRLQKARVIVSLGSDFLGVETGSVLSARQISKGRRSVNSKRLSMNRDSIMSRLYVVESNYTTTGSIADHRLRLPRADVERYALALLRAVYKKMEQRYQSVDNAERPQDQLPEVDTAGIPDSWIDAVADDLTQPSALGHSAIVVGSDQPPRVHALAHWLNYSLGNFARTIASGRPVVENDLPSLESIRKLSEEIDSLDTLIIAEGNPAYDAPADLKFADMLGRDGLVTVHLATHRNETSELCSWHLPQAHELESWGDLHAIDGTLAVQQPLIAPLYGGRSSIELLATLAGEKSPTGYDTVRSTLMPIADYAKKLLAPVLDQEEPEQVWRGGVRRGWFLPILNPVKELSFNFEAVVEALSERDERAPIGKDNIEVGFEPDPTLFDGRHANNLWALELPHPMTKLVWDNAAVMSPATRDALGLRDGQMVRLSKGESKVELPVLALPGHADFSITLSLGWGRTAAGRYGNGKGFNVNPLRTSTAMGFTDGVSVEPLNQHYQLVRTQEHGRMEGRPIALDATVQEYRKEPYFASYKAVDPVSTPPLWKQQDYSEGHKWGMSIDLAACTGCNTCVAACQAENNIPVVGKFEVERGREMHWLRIDRYFVGEDEGDPQVAVQPVTCQQCEEAPCENVCPVNATTHTPEGLNDMAYNRCVGTRYCANNCPYKVRRFNYLDWHGHLDDEFGWFEDFPESRKLQFNPNVTVRMRGVMEKCTYCVQRIQEAKISAKRESRELKDGDIVTACQQACPTQAIQFGDLNDERSLVRVFSALDRGYKLLAEIGTRPRTTFLARVRNINPAIEGKQG